MAALHAPRLQMPQFAPSRLPEYSRPQFLPAPQQAQSTLAPREPQSSALADFASIALGLAVPNANTAPPHMSYSHQMPSQQVPQFSFNPPHATIPVPPESAPTPSFAPPPTPGGMPSDVCFFKLTFLWISFIVFQPNMSSAQTLESFFAQSNRIDADQRALISAFLQKKGFSKAFTQHSFTGNSCPTRRAKRCAIDRSQRGATTWR